MSDTTGQNKMGVMPVKKLLISMSLPMMISMLIQALYNIVDSIFVSQVGENALTAVSLIFPIQNLMIAVAAGTGVGINALLSKNLGARNYEQANLAARNGIFLSTVGYAIFLVVGLTFSRPFMVMQTSDPEIIEYGIQYMRICTTLSFGIFFQMTFERLLMSTGNTLYSMISQATGAIINIILDPILIFGLLGFPRMEVAGAALATVIGQIAGMLVGLYLNVKKNPEININMRKFRPNLPVIGRIYAVGIPTTVMQSIGSIMVMGMNKILIDFSSTAVSVFGVYFKLQSFVFMPVFGLNNGLIPIIAYNYGAKKHKRITGTLRFGMAIAVIIMFVGMIAFQIFPKTLLSMFNASEEMLSIGVPALRTISYCFVLAAFNIVASSIFQGMGNGLYCLFISVCRQLILLLPAAYLLSNYMGLDPVWFAFPIAEAGAFILSIFMLKRIYTKKITPLKLTDK